MGPPLTSSARSSLATMVVTTPSSSPAWKMPRRMMGGPCSTTAVATPSSSADVGLLTPKRRRGHEILDDSAVSASDRIRSIEDVTRSNRIFGGLRAAAAAIDPLLTRGATLSLLDVGTGLADIPATIARR